MSGERLVIVGASGLLGSALRERLTAAGRPFAAPGRDEMDLASLDAIGPALERLRPTAVINASAYTDVARAELPESREEVFLLNRDAPARLARACRALGAPLVHVSTDYVFDGNQARPYREDDPTHPVQVYGQSKLEGEGTVFDEHPDAIVARTSTLYGRTSRARKTYVDAILEQARKKDVIEVVVPPVSSPTYAPDLAACLLDLLDAEARGLFHAVNDGECNRMELARAVVEEAGLADRVEVRRRPEPTAALRRPRYSVLDTSKLSGLTGRRPRPWREALAAYLHEAGT